MTTIHNPLLQPFEYAPFGKIAITHYVPAITELIKAEKQRIIAIIENTETPNFMNVIDAMENSDEQLDKVVSIFFNLNSAETNDNLQNLAEELLPLLSELSNWTIQNRALFEKIKYVFNHPENNLTSEQQYLLRKTYLSFSSNGALLNEQEKTKLSEINTQLSLKQHLFGKNLLAATNAYFKHITDQKLLDGIPENDQLNFKKEAENKSLDGFVINLQQPSVLAVLKHAHNRELRKEISLANASKSAANNEWDNKNTIKEILNLRLKMAKLLGFKNYTEYVLEERMAGCADAVLKLLHDLAEKAKPYAQKEIDELKSIGQKIGLTDIFSYDHAYLAEILKQEKLQFSEEEMKPYFSLNRVLEAVFQLSNQLFGLEFIESFDVPIYHPDVRTYKVSENGAEKALLYLDFFPREGKRAGAWMTNFRNQSHKKGISIRPQISIVCNFSKATSNSPSLLTFSEVTTLFHEFGHALHGILANTHYSSLSGTSVLRDFVELPSQFLENYCYESSFLNTFAKHYMTNESLPQDKIEKLTQYKKFMEGYQTLRQVGFGLLDMAFHKETSEIESIIDFENEILKPTQLYPFVENTSMSCSFSHIFQGGYAVGYYSYKWAEVLDADAFAYFKENGIFNPEIAHKFKTLLSQGGTQNPMDLYIAFRGEKPQIKHLLKRSFK